MSNDKSGIPLDFKFLDLSKTVRISACGRCIYCKKTSGKLQVEHILPAGLGGKVELLAASCTECARVTGAMEQSLLRGPFWPTRMALGQIGNRRKKQRPSEFLRKHVFSGTTRHVSVPVDSVSATLNLFNLAPPAYWGSDGLSNTQIRLMSALGEKPPNLWREEIDFVGSDGIEAEVVNPIFLRRFIAKVLHGYAVLTVGDQFIPFLTDFILGKEEFAGEEFIGSYDIPGALHASQFPIALGILASPEKADLVGFMGIFHQINRSALYCGIIGRVEENLDSLPGFRSGQDCFVPLFPDISDDQLTSQGYHKSK